VFSEEHGPIPLIEREIQTLYDARTRDTFLTVDPRINAHKGGYRHVSKVNVTTRRRLALTFGDFEVTRLLSWDPETGDVYFLGVPISSPEQQHVYVVRDWGTGISSQVEAGCLTCHESNNCTYAQAYFSPAGKHFVFACLGPGVPWTTLRATADPHKDIFSIEENEKLQALVASTAMPHVQILQVPLKDGKEARVKLTLPPIYEDEDDLKYPVLFQVKEDPMEPTVTDQFTVGMVEFLSALRDIACVQIDARGTDNLGKEYRDALYQHIGMLDLKDIHSVAEYLRNKLDFLDSRSMVIWGSGYGGYVAAMSLTREASPFRCAAALAPISSFSLYDAYFSELYLGYPNSTASRKAYFESDIMSEVEEFGSRALLLLHGTSDRVVPLQHTMILSKALSHALVNFQQMIYPDEGHGLEGYPEHVLKTLEGFFDDCFDDWIERHQEWMP
ncbi:unnamed protein product, partial [Darwinula stevensoni]